MYQSLIAFVLVVILGACSTAPPVTITPGTDSVRRDVPRVELPSKARIPCEGIPVARDESIEEIKKTYALTQAALIESCEVRQETIDWWRRNNVQ